MRYPQVSQFHHYSGRSTQALGCGEEMLYCPNCSNPFSTLSHSHISFELCKECDLLWFDYGELASELSTLSNQEFSPTDPKYQFSPHSQKPVSSCPRCSTISLQEGNIADYPLKKCTSCDGLLLNLHAISGAKASNLQEVKKLFLNFINIVRHL